MSADDLSNTEHIFATFLNPEMGMEKAVNTYGAWANEYNKMLKDHEYGGPWAAASAIINKYQHVPDKSQIRIMDMACGTGLVAEDLKAHGFHNIDGVDPSQGMLQVAIEKGIYKNTWCAYVGTGKQLPIEDNTYDALSIVGSMGANMMPCAGILEMIRLVKPGGLIVNVFREEILTIDEEYRGRLLPMMNRLEQEGKWKQVAVSRLEKYLVDKVGLVYVHEVL
ncbi:Williams-Beuren syndrome chromosomal region 27 protein [Plakobranchus ocellatus]|uniref:Williams-Beuren syndrome chromosomal region 27 protein n=1 Tax=Plakobranchus ocellatus TaxID=259542 RepID=A0AAV4BL59_9GAST|nr:Williams-Beuren syndrome chromosomal region 27 protein [Plakobranchus ocellatus]